MTARSKRSRIAGALTVVLSLAALAPLAPTARAQAPGHASGFANSGVLDDVVQPPAQTAPAAQAPAPTQTSGPKPNILFIMGDDIGWMQPSIYHRGLMVGETPNIDRIGNEGAIFMDYFAMQSCTSGRNAFFTGMYPLRTA